MRRRHDNNEKKQPSRPDGEQGGGGSVVRRRAGLFGAPFGRRLGSGLTRRIDTTRCRHVPFGLVTTYDAAILTPAGLPAGMDTGTSDPLIGVDIDTGAVHRWHPMGALDVTGNPNVFISGAPGSGKSATVKTLVHGLRELGDWVVIIDPKGEYVPAAEMLDLPVVDASQPGALRLLDCGAETIHLVLGAMDGRELCIEEEVAITTAVASQPVDLTTFAGLLADHPAVAAAATALALDATLDASSSPARLDTGAVIDLSGLVDRPNKITQAVMATAVTQLRERRPPGVPGHLVVDEAWLLMGSPSCLTILQNASKLGRSQNLSLIMVTHHLRDMAAQADGAAAHRARQLASDAGTTIVHRVVEESSAVEIADTLSLPPGVISALIGFRRGQALIRHGDRSIHRIAVLPPIDLPGINTDPTATNPTNTGPTNTDGGTS